MPRRSTPNAAAACCPASTESRSTTTTSWPARATANAAASPATPPPATTNFMIGTLTERPARRRAVGGPDFKLNEAVSFLTSCEDQDEVDYYWLGMIL